MGKARYEYPISNKEYPAKAPPIRLRRIPQNASGKFDIACPFLFAFIAVLGFLASGLCLAGDDFRWEWDKAQRAQANQPNPPASQEKPPASAGISAEDYANLLRENQNLQTKREALQKGNATLTGEVADLEKRIARFTVLLKSLKKEKDASTRNQGRTAKLETKIVNLESGNAKLKNDRARLKKIALRFKAHIDRLDKQIADLNARATSAPPPVVPAVPKPTVKPGSDLFRDMAKQNAALKKKLVEIETERQKAVKAKGKALSNADEAEEDRKDMKQKLREAKATAKESGKFLKTALKEVAALQEKVGSLSHKLERREVALSVTQEEFRVLKGQVKKGARTDSGAEDAAPIGQTEKRNMQYNMAAIYAMRGEHKEAEKQYLLALKSDPNDPDIHFNLGILYDESLGDKDKAIFHFRKYLQLKPDASDKSAVKTWLLELGLR